MRVFEHDSNLEKKTGHTDDMQQRTLVLKTPQKTEKESGEKYTGLPKKVYKKQGTTGTQRRKNIFDSPLGLKQSSPQQFYRPD